MLGLIVLGSIGMLAWWLGDASTSRMSESSAIDGSPRSPRSAARAETRVDADNEVSAGRSTQPPLTHEVSTSAAAKQDSAEQARRAALREQILVAQRAREAEAAKLAEPSALPNPDPDSDPPPKGLTKHVEGYDQLIDELNKDFLPLSDECIADALARAPELRGQLAINFELVVDEDLGAVIEHADIGPNNEVHDPELQECVRESLLSMLLSPGAADGSAALSITLEVEPGS